MFDIDRNDIRRLSFGYDLQHYIDRKQRTFIYRLIVREDHNRLVCWSCGVVAIKGKPTKTGLRCISQDPIGPVKIYKHQQLEEIKSNALVYIK